MRMLKQVNVINHIRDLLTSIQPDGENRKRDEANEVTLAAAGPAVLVERLQRDLEDAWRAVGVVSDDPNGPVNGIGTALAITDQILGTLPQVRAEGDRLTAACAAFRKVLAKA